MTQWRTLLEILRLTRLATAYGVVSNVWFVILWVRAEGSVGPTLGLLHSTPLWVLLAGGAVQAVGLFAFAITLNDILDLHRDRAMKFDRPLATGSLSAEAAAALIAGTLIGAVMGSTVFGIAGVLITVALAGGALIYNAAARFVPALGLPLIAGLYAGHLFVPAPGLPFVWPVWIVFTHVLVVRLAAHALGRRMPRLSVRGGALLLALWLIGSAALAGLSVWQNGGDLRAVWPSSVHRTAALAPAGLLVLFGLAVWRVWTKRGPGARGEDRVLRYGSLWMPLYNAAWLFGAGHEQEGLVMLGIAAAGPVAIGLIREVYGLVEQPLGYRM